MTKINKICIFLIKAYRKYLSPLKGRTCRFYPSCSQYAIDALQKYGVLKGLYLAIKRVLKCHPFNAGGYDPIK